MLNLDSILEVSREKLINILPPYPLAKRQPDDEILRARFCYYMASVS